MQVVLYTASSFGGIYDYGRQLHAAYQSAPHVDRCVALYPQNAPLQAYADLLPILMPDVMSGGTRLRRQMQFLARSARNPLRLINYLERQPPSLVIFNDFDQLTAPLWVPVWQRQLAGRHRAAVILHDPDRDGYPPSRAASARCMKQLLSVMDLALYHEILPDRPYYAPNGRTRYLDVPHGLYPPPPPDGSLLAELQAARQPGLTYAAIVGNIRPEKNYHLALEALTEVPDLGLIIAGAPCNSAITTESLRAQARTLGVEDRVIWVERFLTEEEMSAVIDEADMLLLYYARSFTSQSGILNMAAPLHKVIVASDGASSLARTLKRFALAVMAPPDDRGALVAALRRAMEGFGPDPADWARYLDYASWARHAGLVLAAARELTPTGQPPAPDGSYAYEAGSLDAPVAPAAGPLVF